MEISKLQITPASFVEAMALKRAIGEALNKKPINITGTNSAVVVGDIMKTEISGELLSSIISPLISVVIDQPVQDALFVCCKRVIYDKKKIDLDFFENITNRPLYYPIMVEVIKVNIGPFFKDLFSGSSIRETLKEILQ